MIHCQFGKAMTCSAFTHECPNHNDDNIRSLNTKSSELVPYYFGCSLIFLLDSSSLVETLDATGGTLVFHRKSVEPPVAKHCHGVSVYLGFIHSLIFPLYVI